jgi:hypothetical protein
MAVGAKQLEQFQNILTNQKQMTEEIEEKNARIAELEAEIKEARQDTKDLEQFRPLLQNIPVNLFKIQLHDSAILRQFIGRMKDVYGPRFGKTIANMNDMDSSETKFVRQCLDSATLACIRYCVSQRSRWNDMVAHYLS